MSIRSIVAIAAAGMMCATPGLSQSPAVSDCRCVVPSTQGGSLVEQSGSVLISQSTGFSPAAEGASLPVGTVVRTGSNGAASISFGGSCSLELSSSQRMTVSAPRSLSGDVCVSVEASQVVTQSGSTGNPSTLAGFGAAVGGGVLLSNARRSKSQ